MRLIDADALLRDIEVYHLSDGKFQHWVEVQPTIDPQRIKGRWIHDGYDIPHGVDWMHCSVCGRREPYVPAAMTNFCPDCGAWMSEELEPEHTMEEFMYGQDLGSPEDGSL